MESPLLVVQGLVIMIKNSFGEWGGSIPTSSLNTTIDYVVTGKTIQDVSHDATIADHIKESNRELRILDFGCGVGRNAIFFAENYPLWNITGYDNPSMLKQMHNFCQQKYNKSIDNIKNLTLFDNWDLVKIQYFDYIYATLVFQHIREDILLTYLEDIKNMTKNLLVFGRRYNDHSSYNTWAILEKAKLYPINTSYQRDGDNHEHSWCIYQLS